MEPSPHQSCGLTDRSSIRPDITPKQSCSSSLFGEKFPSIPRNPSKDDALKALELLKGLFTTFPFVDGPDRSVVLVAVLSALVRRWLPTSPLYAITSPVAGSGKSLLVDIISMIVTGRRAPVIAQGKSEEELEKRLGAILMANDAIVSIDNCEHPLGGVFLCQILIRQGAKMSACWAKAAPSKCLQCRVVRDSATTFNSPAICQGEHFFLHWIRWTNARSCWNSRLTRSRWSASIGQRMFRQSSPFSELHFLAGLPSPATPLGSFEIWSDRFAVLSFGWESPTPAIRWRKARDFDRRLSALTTILNQWEAVLGEDRFLARQVAERASEREIRTISHSDIQISGRH